VNPHRRLPSRLLGKTLEERVVGTLILAKVQFFEVLDVQDTYQRGVYGDRVLSIW